MVHSYFHLGDRNGIRHVINAAPFIIKGSLMKHVQAGPKK